MQDTVGRVRLGEHVDHESTAMFCVFASALYRSLVVMTERVSRSVPTSTSSFVACAFVRGLSRVDAAIVLPRRRVPGAPACHPQDWGNRRPRILVLDVVVRKRDARRLLQGLGLGGREAVGERGAVAGRRLDRDIPGGESRQFPTFLPPRIAA